MRYDTSHIHGHHQARWFMVPEGAEFRQTVAAKIGYCIHCLLKPKRNDPTGRNRIYPGQSIESIGTGYQEPFWWRKCKDEVQ